MKQLKWFIVTVFALAFYSCELGTELPIDDDTPQSMHYLPASTVDNLFHNWYNIKNNYYGPGLMLAEWADQTDLTSEGREILTSTGELRFQSPADYGKITEDYFYSMHKFLADANSLAETLALENHTEVSLVRFAQGAALGSLALVFKKVYPEYDGQDFKDSVVDYQLAVSMALAKLDLGIEAAEKDSFALKEGQIHKGTISNNTWSEFLNTLAARILVNSARNKNERKNIDWDRVLNYAENGLTKDFEVGQDGWKDWRPDHIAYSIHRDWGRVDKRIIQLMHPNDERLDPSLNYLHIEDSTEGEKHYRHSRYDDWLEPDGILFEMLKAENDLYLAEAYLRKGNLIAAAAVINKGTRIDHGLELVEEKAETIEHAIHYERLLELMNTGMGLGFFQMRGMDSLQPGKPFHFPLPEGALEAADFAR